MANPHPVPKCVTVMGHDQCPKDYGSRDDELERVTEGTMMGALIRVVAKYDPYNHTFDRTRICFQIFKNLELGWAHMSGGSGGNSADILYDIANRLPNAAAFAWPDHAEQMKRRSYCDQIAADYKHKLKQLPEYNWLLAGWHQIAPYGDVQSGYTERWYKDIASKGVNWMRANGYKSRRVLAAAVRARNTSGTQLGRLQSLVREQGEEKGLQSFLVEYDHPKLSRAVWEWGIFDGSIDKWPEPSDIPWPRSETAILPAVETVPMAKRPDIEYTSQGPGWKDRIVELPWKWIAVGAGVLAAAGAGVAGVIYLRRKRKA